jgi:hypothetical protein
MQAGKEFGIFNFTTGDLNVTDVEMSSSDIFHWEIDPWNYSLPFTMAYSDTVSLTVKITPPVDNHISDFLVDTLDITTEYGSHQVIIKAAATGRWKGTVSNDWNNPANWCDQTLPSDTTNIFIPAGAAHAPLFTGNLTIGGDCGDLIIAGYAQLTVTGIITVNPGSTLLIRENGVIHQVNP